MSSIIHKNEDLMRQVKVWKSRFEKFKVDQIAKFKKEIDEKQGEI